MIPKYMVILKRKPRVGDWIIPKGRGWVCNIDINGHYKPVIVRAVWKNKRHTLSIRYGHECFRMSAFHLIDPVRTLMRKKRMGIGQRNWW